MTSPSEPEPISDRELEYFRQWRVGDDDGTGLADAMHRIISRIDAAESSIAPLHLRSKAAEEGWRKEIDWRTRAETEWESSIATIDSLRLRAERAERALKEIRALGGTSNAIQNARGIASEALMAALTSSEGEQ